MKLPCLIAILLSSCTYERPADVPDERDAIPCPNGVSDCPSAAEPTCGEATCTNGICGMTFVADGTAQPSSAQTEGDCATWVCDGAGGRRSQPASDPQDDGQACTNDICVDGATEHQPLNGTVDCYTGESSTLGVGQCHSGTQQCNNGVATGACIGETIPVAEDCDVGLRDEDCDGVVNEEGATCQCVPGVASACYEGPNGTADVGVCKSGSHTCLASGLGFTECAGDVFPSATEVCDGGTSQLDENCSGAVDEGCVCAPSTTVECAYTGPSGTKDVGACRAATHVCDASGTGYATSCAGEVLPTFDWCTTAAIDENCSGTAATCTGAWLGNLGSNGNNSFARLLAVASDGSSVAATGVYSLRLVKHSAAGAVLWSKLVDASPHYLTPAAVAIDGSGNVLVTGMAAGPVDFGGGVLTPTKGQYYNGDIFIVKYDANGNHVWSKLLDPGVADSNRYSWGRGITADPAGNVIVVGRVASPPLDFGGGAISSSSTCGSSNEEDAFIVKYSPAGAHYWSHRYSGPNDCSYQGFEHVSTDANGSIYVASSNYFALPGLAAGNSHKFDGNGTPLWSGSAGATAMAVSSTGNVTFAYGGASLSVYTYNASGTQLWSKTFAGTGTVIPRGVAVAPTTGAIAVLANFTQAVDLGFGIPQPAGAYLGISVLDATGVPQFAEYVPSTEAGISIGIDAQDDVYVMTNSGGTWSLAGQTPPDSAQRQVVVKLDR